MQPAARLPFEMDLFAFVDIIGIRAIGFPVVLTFRSLRITFLRGRRAPSAPKGESIIPQYCTYRLLRVYAYARKRGSILSFCR